MSIEALNWARKQPTRNCARRAVLMALANVANDEGFVRRVSVEYLMGWTDLSRSVVFQRLKELEAGGAVFRERGKDRTGSTLISCDLNLAGYYENQNSAAPNEGARAIDKAEVESGGPDYKAEVESGGPDYKAEVESGGPDLRVRPAGLALNDLNLDYNLSAREGAREEPGQERLSEGEEETGGGGPSGDLAEPEKFQKFVKAFPFDPSLMAIGEAKRAFARLSQKDRARALRRAAGYGESCRAAKRAPMDCAEWLIARKFDDAAAAAKARGTDLVFVARGTRAWDAWCGRGGHKPTLATLDRASGKTGWWFKSLYPPGSAPGSAPGVMGGERATGPP